MTIDGLANLVRFALPTLVMAALNKPRRSHTKAGAAPRILVTRLDQIGDFIMTTPLLRELKRNFPDSPITLVVRANAAPLAQPCPYADRVLVLEPEKSRQSYRSYAAYLRGFCSYLTYLKHFAKQQLQGQVDLAIHPRWDVDREWSGLLVWLSGAGRRIGYTEKTSPQKALFNAGHNVLLTDVLPAGPDMHETDRNLRIVEHLGGSVSSRNPEAWWSVEDRRQAEEFAAKTPMSKRTLCVAFGIGASGGRRLWPHYAELIAVLQTQLDFMPLLIAGPGEEGLAEAIRDKAPSSVIVKNKPLGAVAALLASCNLFIGNDSGPMHLAASVKIPVVEISCHPVGADFAHVNSPDRTGPLCDRRTIIRPTDFAGNCKGGCNEDYPHCITAISPQQVMRSALLLLEKSGQHTGNLAVAG